MNGAGVLVAGGASGLGAATAKRFAANGARVTIADVSADVGGVMAERIGAHFVACDVRDEQAVSVAVAEAAAAPLGLRVAVSCAGVTFPHKIASRRRGPHPFDEFKRVVDVNLLGTFNVMRLAATAMLDNDPGDGGARGVLINTASVAAFEGQAGQLAYSASKGAIVAMTLTAARDLARDGIRVVTIAPGIFDTPLLGRRSQEKIDALTANVPFPRRLGNPDEFAQLAHAIVDNEMLNGVTIRLDGALRLPPA